MAAFKSRLLVTTGLSSSGSGYREVMLTNADGSVVAATKENLTQALADTLGQSVQSVQDALNAVSGRTTLLEQAVTSINQADTDYTARIADLTNRVTKLENTVKQVFHFKGSAAVPTIAALGFASITLNNPTPVTAGDSLKMNDAVAIVPESPLPSGVSISSVRVSADNVVTIQLTTLVAITVASAPIVFDIVALR